MEYLSDLFYAVPLLLLAGIIDGIAGGGGIIALPTYLLTGMPVLSAYACNKLQSGFGTLCSAMTLVKNKYVDFNTTLCALPCTICASMLATELLKEPQDRPEDRAFIDALRCDTRNVRCPLRPGRRNDCDNAFLDTYEL